MHIIVKLWKFEFQVILKNDSFFKYYNIVATIINYNGKLY